MESKNIILQEAEQISPAVANIGNHNVYTVPAGYFDGLHAQVLARVQGAALPAAPAPYAVPEGYFDNLAGNIMAKIKAQAAPQAGDIFFDDEVSTGILPPYLPTPYSIPQGYFDSLAANVLAAIKQQQLTEAEATLPFIAMPYTVPQGYFDGLANNVLTAIKQQERITEETSLPFIAMPYTVPQGYFDNLAGNVMAKINTGTVQHGSEAAKELEELSPLLSSIGKQMPYSVPQGYFEQFEVNIPAEEKPVTKVVSMQSSRRKWFTYAAAACVAVILGVGGFMFRGVKTIDPPVDGYVKALANVSDADIRAYLDEQPATTIDAGAQQDEQEPDVQKDIEQTSTQDIQQYLNENSGPDEKRGKDI